MRLAFRAVLRAPPHSAQSRDTIDGGTLYFTVRFTGKTSFCLRYVSDMIIVSADLSDWRDGNYNVIREYMKPIPT